MPVSSSSSVNKGDIQSPIQSPIATHDSEGASVPSNSQGSEGDINPNDLLMPEMFNLETAGHRRSSRIASQPPKK